MRPIAIIGINLFCGSTTLILSCAYAESRRTTETVPGFLVKGEVLSSGKILLLYWKQLGLIVHRYNQKPFVYFKMPVNPNGMVYTGIKSLSLLQFFRWGKGSGVVRIVVIREAYAK